MTSTLTSPAAQAATDHTDQHLYSKVGWRLLPLLVLCYVVAFLDRINIGFAQVQMKQTLPFSDEAYALGAGIFFIGYLLFEVPSNLLLEKIGARKTLLRIMFCWGLVASAMMFVQTTTQFYVLRFLLGAFEAGFGPGVILYLTYWYPSTRRGRAIAIFLAGNAIASLIAGPFSGAVMKYMDGLGGHHGWQWLFLVQGLPATLLGIVVYLYLHDRPEEAGWLGAQEKARLRHLLDDDRQSIATGAHGSRWALLKDPKVYCLALSFMLLAGAAYTMIFSIPTLIRSWGVQDMMTIGLMTSLPSVVGIVAMVLVSRSSDRRGERRWHYVLTVGLTALGLAVMMLANGNLAVAVAGLALLSIGHASPPLFFTTVSEYLPARTAAGGIALISSLGNLGPAFLPALATRINTATGSPLTGQFLVIALYLLSGLLLLKVVKPAGVRAA